MPVHVDIRINDELIHRIHIARMSRSGMQPDSVNTYSVVAGEKEPVFTESGMRMGFPAEPTWLQWEQGEKFTHRYGDDALICVQKALTVLNAENEERQLREQLHQAQEKIAALKKRIAKLTGEVV